MNKDNQTKRDDEGKFTSKSSRKSSRKSSKSSSDKS
jgi:hypothetical protein